MGFPYSLSLDGFYFCQGTGDFRLLPEIGTVGGHTGSSRGCAGQLESVIQALQAVFVNQEQVGFNYDLV